MYAFRKPFAAATFEGEGPLHSQLAFKTSLVIIQIIGYAISKYLGIRILPSLDPRFRSLAIVGLVNASWLALLLFAVAPGILGLCAMVIPASLHEAPPLATFDPPCYLVPSHRVP